MLPKNSTEYIISVEFPKIFATIESFLKPQNRGFELVYSGEVPNSFPHILYQSNQCKLRIKIQRDREYEGIEVYVDYGRLHAPLDKNVIEWNHEKCYCWHHVEPILNFLDGLSPLDVDNPEFFSPGGMQSFYEVSKTKNWLGPEFFMRKHAFIWEQYGERFFNLLDVRHSDLWEEYVDFLEKHHRAKEEKRKSSGKFVYLSDPPRYKIC